MLVPGEVCECFIVIKYENVKIVIGTKSSDTAQRIQVPDSTGSCLNLHPQWPPNFNMDG